MRKKKKKQKRIVGNRVKREKPIKPSTCRAKGKRNEREIAARLAAVFGLDLEDFYSCRTGQRECDIQLSRAAKERFPFHVEAKHVNNFNVWAALHQAESEAKDGFQPIVIFKRDGSKRYVAIDFDEFLKWIT